ncbi:MAG: hypothetical protein LBC29_04310, partial [Propionibacteriaceae bacterium]|nr:hypothetical protein [Propionibacteriaceae bacterium]
PDAAYNGGNAPQTFEVTLAVTASIPISAEFEELYQKVKTSVPFTLEVARENYDAAAITALDEVWAQTEAAIAGGLASQDTAITTLAGLKAALAALEHDHPVLENSATDTVLTGDTELTIRIKGAFITVIRITIDEREAYAYTTDDPLNGQEDAIIPLILDGIEIGTLSKGSAKVELTPEFINSLPDGTHTITVYFRDPYGEGSGTTTFTVAHPISPTGGTLADTNNYVLALLVLPIPLILFALAGLVRKRKES